MSTLNKNMIKYDKIFIIGLNKTATTTIHKIFKENNFRSIHWMCPKNKKYENSGVQISVKNNFLNNKKLLDEYLYKKYDVFSDIENLAINFKILDQQYPNSLFIYNYRSLNSWLLSRLNHMNGNYINYYRENHTNMLSYFKYGNNIKDFNKNNIINIWEKLYINHRKNVEEYFREKDNIIYYDIEKESTTDFVKKLPFEMKVKNIQKTHVTKNKKWKLENNEFIQIKN